MTDCDKHLFSSVNVLLLLLLFQKLAFYSKMQEAQDSVSGGSSFSGPTIKEEDCTREKDHPPEAEYINSRCVLFTYFQGDISSVVDEHFSRALSQRGTYVSSSASAKPTRGTASRRDGDPYTAPKCLLRTGCVPEECGISRYLNWCIKPGGSRFAT